MQWSKTSMSQHNFFFAVPTWVPDFLPETLVHDHRHDNDKTLYTAMTEAQINNPDTFYRAIPKLQNFDYSLASERCCLYFSWYRNVRVGLKYQYVFFYRQTLWPDVTRLISNGICKAIQTGILTTFSSMFKSVLEKSAFKKPKNVYCLAWWFVSNYPEWLCTPSQTIRSWGASKGSFPEWLFLTFMTT